MTLALEIDGLAVRFASEQGPVPAVEDVSLGVAPGRTLCLVGESGSGKSVSILAAMGLLDPRRAHVEARRLRLGDLDLLHAPSALRRRVHGDRIAMVFQDPMTSLHPYLRVGVQLRETVLAHRKLPAQAVDTEVLAMLDAVGIPDPRARLAAYPHELSGGMRQRVVLAMALLNQPDVLLADEPTTALDVTIQAQVLQLIRDQQARTGMAVVLVTHDMGVVAHMADDVAVLYGGQVVEYAPVEPLFATPQHPYTRALLASIPDARQRGGRLPAIAGTPPRPQDRPAGCVFAPRCKDAIAACAAARPALTTLPPSAGREGTRQVRCLRHDGHSDA